MIKVKNFAKIKNSRKIILVNNKAKKLALLIDRL